MYYFKLIIEESAIANITTRLKPFVNSTDLEVNDVKMTTICEKVSTGAECRCLSDSRWSDAVCQETDGKCCGDSNCTFTNKPARMVGSVIADFEMTFAHKVDQEQLMNKTELLSAALLGSVDLETTGQRDTPASSWMYTHRTIMVLKWFFRRLCGSTKKHHLLKNLFFV
ncbi:hypothetical protein EYF80_067355 [Liparis tanakae]|uniref:Uncharacterized protein n=1 Tax=Liparis tanakae TaxID=230148 RepID=A0A4Z2E192_9TELE|nr:hypothetical protein EYF80_067355 [Liparis tanakae]